MPIHTDKEYYQAKRIYQGNERMSPRFKVISEYLLEEHGIQAIDVALNEWEEGYTLFVCIADDPSWQKIGPYVSDNHKRLKRLVQTHFESIFFKKPKFILPRLLQSRRDKRRASYKDIMKRVEFWSFQKVAKDEVNHLMTSHYSNKVKLEINDKRYWRFFTFFSQVTLFVYLESDVKKCILNGSHQKWENIYFAEMKKHDPFDFWKRSQFKTRIDSQENFLNNYEGSWLRYLR